MKSFRQAGDDTFVCVDWHRQLHEPRIHRGAVIWHGIEELLSFLSLIGSRG